MIVGDRYPCFMCVSGESQLRLDKRQRPFFKCSKCGCIIFPGDGIQGPTRLWGRVTLALRAGDDEAAREIVRREQEAVRREEQEVEREQLRPVQPATA
jgi:hypothetical protein